MVTSAGVQAQTIANYNAIRNAKLFLVSQFCLGYAFPATSVSLLDWLTSVCTQIPVITKIDLPTSDPEMSLKQMHTALGALLHARCHDMLWLRVDFRCLQALTQRVCYGHQQRLALDVTRSSLLW